MAIATGSRLGPYEVIDLLGEGGMGRVYRARDPRLGRDVAIKVLPPELAADLDSSAGSGSSRAGSRDERLRRFEQEARAASALNHPNILTVFDVGTHDGAPYLVTELLEGESLRERLTTGPLPVRDAVELGVQAAAGLAAAHAKGIVHRDLKPENLFLTADGRVKILDFGLAKLVTTPQDAAAAPTAAGPTQAGVVMGTVAYMSPEQARGQEVDHRSDLFSFGAVLFEVLTGVRAFARDTAADTLSAILKEEPPPLDPPSGSVPAGLERIVRRCVAKRPEDRFASASDLHAALQSLVQASSPAFTVNVTPEKSILVLPFDNLSPDPENAYFADGLTEEIISDLAKVRALRVISRTSAMLFRGSKKDVPTIARELNVRYVLEGSVRRAGRGLRITAQLIDGANDAHLWAEKYTGTIDDVFDMQEKVSRAIVDALRLTLTSEESHRLAARSIPNVAAFDLYLRARQELFRLTEAALDHAAELAAEALEIAGPNALLFSLLAEIEFFNHDQGIHSDEETLGRAQTWASKALELEPESAAGLAARGLIRQRRGDMPGAVRDLRRAAQRQASGEVLASLAWILAEAGRTEEARRYATQAVAIDPLLWMAWWGEAWVALLDGEFEIARQRFQHCARLGGGELVQVFFQGVASAYAGRLDEARDLFDRVANSGGRGFSTVAAVLSALLRRDAGKAGELLRDDALRELATLDKEISWWLAAGCSFAGKTEEALDWLANAISLGFVNHRFFSAIDPFLAPLRGDPRFQALMERAKKQQAELEAGL